MQLIIIGNVGNDPEIKYIENGIAVCNLSVAVSSREAGERNTIWYSVTTWRKTAEAVANYVKKGHKIMVQGTPGLETYDGRDGKTHAKLVFPTHVGVNRLNSLFHRWQGSFPHTRGGEPVIFWNVPFTVESFPHTRGGEPWSSSHPKTPPPPTHQPQTTCRIFPSKERNHG